MNSHDEEVTTAPRRDDSRIWRVYGDPLAPARRSGPLSGLSVAVKDVIGVAGYAIGYGNPFYLAQAPVNPHHAEVVQQLLEAGASVQGISHSDEFAYSLDGVNEHYGASPNRFDPDRLGGGSSSGSASAVAWGFADIGLGTDTGGSIRIPAAYQGLYGLRPTHGAVPVAGVLPMAESFDSVGWMTKEASLLRQVGEVLLPVADDSASGDFVVVPELLALADAQVQEPVARFAHHIGAQEVSWPGISLDHLSDFVIWQAFEVWSTLGAWVSKNLEHIGDEVRERFEMAALIGERDAAEAHENLSTLREQLLEWLGNRVLVLPTAPTLAPKFNDDLSVVRGQIQRLTCVSGITRAPALSIPIAATDGLSVGVSLLAAPGRDRLLLDLAVELADEPLH